MNGGRPTHGRCRSLRLVAAAAALAILAACGARLTPERFNRVQDGMSQQEVIGILGQPTRIESGGFPLLNITGTQFIYEGRRSQCTIAFVNDKVVLRQATFSKRP